MQFVYYDQSSFRQFVQFVSLRVWGLIRKMGFYEFSITFVLFLLITGWLTYIKARRQRLLSAVQVTTWNDVSSSFFAHRRDIIIFGPVGRREGAAEPNLLLVNDGQDHEGLLIRETLANMSSRGDLTALVVVAVPTGEGRLQEYGTAVAPNAQGLGREADAYSQFITTELIPMLQTRLGVGFAAAKTAVCGASLGGLSAFDLAWNFPQLFGAVGVFSGAFWWRAAPEETAIAPGRRIAHEMVRETAVRHRFRGWFQAATLDETSDRDGNGVIDAVQDTLELIAEIESRSVSAKDIIYHEVAGGRHNYDTWSQIFPIFLKWVFAG